jgi:K319L-like, PKD domain/Planctomycete cytochrome C
VNPRAHRSLDTRSFAVRILFDRSAAGLLAGLLLAGCNFDSSLLAPNGKPSSLDNQSPVANAGPDVTVTDADGNGTEPVGLDGTGSTDPDGTIATHLWTEGSRFLAAGPTPTVTLSTGTHTITLAVTDNRGAAATDDVVVSVVPSTGNGNHPPTANAGTDRSVPDADGNGSETVALNGSGTDSDGTITAYRWSEGSSTLATSASADVTLGVGAHTLTLRVTDNDGATGSDTVVITVTPPPGNVSYSQDIQPYFDAHCVSCHRNGGDAGVDLDTWQHVMNGGQSGALVVPGDSSRGTLLPKIRGGHKGAPHGTNIAQDLADWIDAGAPNN